VSVIHNRADAAYKPALTTSTAVIFAIAAKNGLPRPPHLYVSAAVRVRGIGTISEMSRMYPAF
jgi:hypothetical protein